MKREEIFATHISDKKKNSSPEYINNSYNSVLEV